MNPINNQTDKSFSYDTIKQIAKESPRAYSSK
jgi:hypothetical protein